MNRPTPRTTLHEPVLPYPTCFRSGRRAGGGPGARNPPARVRRGGCEEPGPPVQRDQLVVVDAAGQVDPPLATHVLDRGLDVQPLVALAHRSEEPTSELQSLMRISYAVFCL